MDDAVKSWKFWCDDSTNNSKTQTEVAPIDFAMTLGERGVEQDVEECNNEEETKNEEEDKKEGEEEKKEEDMNNEVPDEEDFWKRGSIQ